MSAVNREKVVAKKTRRTSKNKGAVSTQLPERIKVGRASPKGPLVVVDQGGLLSDLRALIETARQRVATVANSGFTLLCWHVGQRLLRENLHRGRATYGKQIGLVTG